MGQYTIKDIESRAVALKNDVDNIYRALNDKLGSSPETLDQVPEYIMSIPDLPTEEPLTITPTIDGQEISALDDLKYNPITVEPVTSAIDSNIQPENIKEGVTILGVVGTLEEGITPAGTKTITDNGTYDVTNYASAEVNVGGTPDYRYAKGTIDKEGLKAIGWTDEDILTYEQNKTPHYPWENDQYKVSDENKALYNLDNPNYSLYKNNPNITFIPNKNLDDYFNVNNFGNMKYIKGFPFFNCHRANMGYMFENCSSLTTIPSLNTYLVESMQSMFRSCSSLVSIPQLNTSGVTNMISMFYYCSSLVSIPQFNTANVTSLANMFYYCKLLTTIPLLNTTKVTNMESMFYGCSSLTSIPQLDTTKVTNMDSMFYSCSSLTSIPQLDTSGVSNMYRMLYNCSSLKKVEGIDFSGLTSNLTQLFGYASSMPNITRFIVNGKINVSISDDYSIAALTAIDYDSVKSILAAADRTDNTNKKTLAFKRTMTDQNGELAALVSSCTSKGWTISGLTLQ